MQLQKRFIVGPCQGFPLSCYGNVINRTNTDQWMPNRCANPTLHTSHRFWCLVISISDTCQMKSKFWKIRDQLLSSAPFFIRMRKTWKCLPALQYMYIHFILLWIFALSWHYFCTINHRKNNCQFNLEYVRCHMKYLFYPYVLKFVSSGF